MRRTLSRPVHRHPVGTNAIRLCRFSRHVDTTGWRSPQTDGVSAHLVWLTTHDALRHGLRTVGNRCTGSGRQSPQLPQTPQPPQTHDWPGGPWLIRQARHPQQAPRLVRRDRAVLPTQHDSAQHSATQRYSSHLSATHRTSARVSASVHMDHCAHATAGTRSRPLGRIIPGHGMSGSLPLRPTADKHPDLTRRGDRRQRQRHPFRRRLGAVPDRNNLFRRIQLRSVREQ